MRYDPNEADKFTTGLQDFSGIWNWLLEFRGAEFKDICAMEEKKDQQLAKKVRFDLNEEVFLIPSKWDRLSKCKTTNARIIHRMAGKNRTIVDRRSDIKSKQNRNRKTQNVSTSSKLDSNPEPNGRFSDNNRPNSTPNVKTINARKTVRYKEGNENANSGNSTSPVEGRLKFYHRPSQE